MPSRRLLERLNLHYVLCLLVAALALAQSCRPIDESELQSIEAVIGEQVDGERRCGPSLGNDQNIRSTLERAYSAAPIFLRESLPPLNELVVLDQSECYKLKDELVAANAFNTTYSNQEKWQACWDIKPNQLQPVIYLAPNAKAIHTNLIQMMVYAYVELYVDRLYSLFTQGQVDQQARLGQETLGFLNTFRKHRQILTETLLPELEGAGYNEAVSRFSSVLGVPKHQLHHSINLQNFFLAELTDAYYCSHLSFSMFDAAQLTKTRLQYADFAELFGIPWFAGAALQAAD